MKRLILSVVFLFIVSVSYAANKMSMVTYFPVPYVAYSQVNVDQQLDVGLTTTCNMNLGCSQSNTNLKANIVNLTAGKLELNQGKGILGDSILLGSTNGTGQIQFKDVRIQRGDMQSVNADTVNVQTLNLFGKPFPSCKEKDGKGQMKWQELKLQGYSGTDSDGELYLVCGDTKVSAEPEKGCSDASYKVAHKGECCPSAPKTDTVCWTWSDPCKNYSASVYRWAKEWRSTGANWGTNSGGGQRYCSNGNGSIPCPSSCVDANCVKEYYVEKTSSLSKCSSYGVSEGSMCWSVGMGSIPASCFIVDASRASILDNWHNSSGSGEVSWYKYSCEPEPCTASPGYIQNGW